MSMATNVSVLEEEDEDIDECILHTTIHYFQY